MLFEEQIARFPDKYPWAQDFIDAMWAGFWTPNIFDFKSDYHNFKRDMSEPEKRMVVRTISAIAQIEIAVKKFWAQLGDNLPHPSINDLGIVMAHVETVHERAYRKLLETLNLTKAINENLEDPIIKGRVEYLRKYLKKVYKDDKKQYIYSIILFTLFIENVSLFSQFYIVLWLNRNKAILRDTSQQVNYTSREEDCLSLDTQILTPNGWKFVKDMNVGDSVYQYTNNGTLEATTVLHTTRKHFSGEMIEFSRSGNNALVTPTHDMIVHYDNDGPNTFRKIKAKDIKFHKMSKVPRATILDGGTIDELSDYDRLRIAIQADGTRRYWTNKEGERLLRGKNNGSTYSVSVTKERKIQRMDDLLSRMDIKYNKRQSTKANGVTYTHYDFYIQEEGIKEFSNWVDLTDKTANWCEQFIDELSHWGGWVDASGKRGYCSTNKENIDIAQSIGILSGHHCKITPKVDDRSDKFNDSWRVHFTKLSTNLPISHSIKKTAVPYNDDVVCVTVPSGMILTRRKDHTFIVGNCHAQAGIKIINTLREEYPELFDKDLEDRIIEESKFAYETECKVIDWIMDGHSDGDLNSDNIKAFIGDRINQSLQQIGYQSVVTVDDEHLKNTYWMQEEIYGNRMTDFFKGHPTDYAKQNKVYDIDDMF